MTRAYVAKGCKHCVEGEKRDKYKWLDISWIVKVKHSETYIVLLAILVFKSCDSNIFTYLTSVLSVAPEPQLSIFAPKSSKVAHIYAKVAQNKLNNSPNKL